MIQGLWKIPQQRLCGCQDVFENRVLWGQWAACGCDREHELQIHPFQREFISGAHLHPQNPAQLGIVITRLGLNALFKDSGLWSPRCCLGSGFVSFLSLNWVLDWVLASFVRIRAEPSSGFIPGSVKSQNQGVWGSWDQPCPPWPCQALELLLLKKANCSQSRSVYNQTQNRCLLIKTEILMNDLCGFGE